MRQIARGNKLSIQKESFKSHATWPIYSQLR